MANKVSVRQVEFIEKLLTERVYNGEEINFEVLTSKDASDLIGSLLKAPRAAGVVGEVGMYRMPNGDIYRVHPSKMSSRLYAKKLNALEGGFEYEAGAIYRLKPEHKMSLEQAKAFGMETGMCCVCGIFLTDPKSVADGIGPVCAKNNGF